MCVCARTNWIEWKLTTTTQKHTEKNESLSGQSWMKRKVLLMPLYDTTFEWKVRSFFIWIRRHLCVCECVCGKDSSVHAFPLNTLNIYLGFVCLWSVAAALCAHIAPNWTECARRFCVAIDFIAICVTWTWYQNASAEDTKVNKLQFQIKIRQEINVNEKKTENQEHVLLSHTIRILLRFNWKYTHFECDTVHEDIK